MKRISFYTNYILSKCYLIVLSFVLIFINGCSNFHTASNLNNKRINNLLDVNGDNKSDLIFFNCNNSECFFEIINLSNLGHQLINLGSLGDIPVFGDFTGDKNFDYGIYRNKTIANEWSLIDGLTMSSFKEGYGEVGDLPVPSDYDGDGKYDFVVYRPKNSGFYGNLSNKNKQLKIHFGLTGDMPVIKDYDGDAQADIATYRLASGSWSVKLSKSGLTKYLTLGGRDYFPIPSDYDGDGKADFAVWNYKDNDCKIVFSFLNRKLSNNNSLHIKEKLKGVKCFPVSSDYDGDGNSELAFWEYGKNLVHIFKVAGNNVKYDNATISLKSRSEPINYFLIHKYLNQDLKNTPKFLYEKYKYFLSLSKNQIEGNYDGDSKSDYASYNPNTNTFIIKLSSDPSLITIPFSNNSGEPLYGDFDGDGIFDVGLLDKNDNSFTFYSIGLNKFSDIVLNTRVVGFPFAFDIDIDFKSDLVVYNPDTNIFGYYLSSENYEYGEIYFDNSIVRKS